MWNDQRQGHWIEVVGELLANLGPVFPAARIAGELAESIEAGSVAWTCLNEGGSTLQEWSSFGPVALDSAAVGLAGHHPLVRWASATHLLRPQTIAPRPLPFDDAVGRAAWHDVASPWGFEHQIYVPMWLGPGDLRAFALSRPDEDFSDADIHLLQTIGPVIAGLYRQVGVLVAHREAIGQLVVTPDDVGLTARELTVLVLLSQGLSAVVIAHRLGVTARTVNKHLEHVYTKLGAHDRLTAVLRAQHLGLIVALRAPITDFRSREPMASVVGAGA